MDANLLIAQMKFREGLSQTFFAFLMYKAQIVESPTDMQQQRISYMNLGVGNPFKVCYDIIFDITYVVLPQKVKFEVMKSWSFDVMFGEEFLLTYQTHCREKKSLF